ncbi:sigma-70 family RNA polymerase sigma factor [Streptomyces sp. NPDC056716]|uniref:sigma-70 family RNA polymerase sigma factor n=1 Tax=unclassified Streptomyces TaxID=2593676 RepID=UPI0036A50684
MGDGARGGESGGARAGAAALVRAAQEGDQRARQELIAQYLPLVYNIVGRALNGHADVDDVVQETMIRALNSLGSLREPDRFRSWLVAITMNRIRGHVHAHRTAPVVQDSLHEAYEAYDVPDPGADFVDLAILRLGLAGQRREVAEASRWLDDDDRALLSLWWLEAAGRLSRAEVAAALELSPQHTAVRVQRMKTQLESSRVVVRALATVPRCVLLGDAVAHWDGVPSALWRKRLVRHTRDCTVCGGLGQGLAPAEGLLVGLALVPVGTGLAATAIGRPDLATAGTGVWPPDARAADTIWPPDALGATTNSPRDPLGTTPNSPPDQLGTTPTWPADALTPTPTGPPNPLTTPTTGPQNPLATPTTEPPDPLTTTAPQDPVTLASDSGGRSGRLQQRHTLRRRRRRRVVVAAFAALVTGGGTIALLTPDDGTDVPSSAVRENADATAARTAPDPSSAPVSASPSASASPSPSASRSPSPSASPSPTRKPSPSASSTPPAPEPTPSKTSVPPPPPPQAPPTTFAGQVLELVNAERADAGCSPVRQNAALDSAAQGHSADMAARDFFDHTNPDGADPGDRITAAGYRWSTYAENIAMGQQTPAEVMQSWMDSPGHRANILNCSVEETGLGVYEGAGGPWWTQVFGTQL